MAKKNIKLIREQLDATLQRFKPILLVSPPKKGWIRAVRDALGMTGLQFSKRLNVNPSRVTEMEHGEISGSLTIKTMRKAAESLNCVFVYAIVPQKTLEDIVKKQIQKAAHERFNRISHTMDLEDQELSSKEKKKALKELEEELLRSMPKFMWDNR